jgi:hypothetical protein
MSKTYILEPEVPGGLGPRTRMDRSVHPPKVETLHFVFDGWLGDQLIESFPCYLITLELAALLSTAGVTGFELGEADIETSEQFKELYPQRVLPPFRWLQIVGTPAKSDIYLTSDNRLAGSQKTLDAVLATNPKGFEFREALSSA